MGLTSADVATCDFATLLSLEDQMPRVRFEQIKAERPDFARWIDQRRTRPKAPATQSP